MVKPSWLLHVIHHVASGAPIPSLKAFETIAERLVKIIMTRIIPTPRTLAGHGPWCCCQGVIRVFRKHIVSFGIICPDPVEIPAGQSLTGYPV
jgi:hypothetical protein